MIAGKEQISAIGFSLFGPDTNPVYGQHLSLAPQTGNQSEEMVAIAALVIRKGTQCKAATDGNGITTEVISDAWFGHIPLNIMDKTDAERVRNPGMEVYITIGECNNRVYAGFEDLVDLPATSQYPAQQGRRYIAK